MAGKGLRGCGLAAALLLEFLLQSLKQFRDHPGPGRDTIMAASLYGFKDDELADVAHFLAHFR